MKHTTNPPHQPDLIQQLEETFDVVIDTSVVRTLEETFEKIREEKIREGRETFTQYVSRQPYGYMTKLVKDTGLGKSTVSAIYLGKRKASQRTAVILSEATGLSVVQVLASFTKEEE